ncbi:MAG: sigma 54-interacting transcriptional regulator [Pirellulaceae bacterium]
MTHTRIVQIVAADQGLASTLSAAVSTIKGCVARTSAGWPNDDFRERQQGLDTFLMVVHVNQHSPESVASTLEGLTKISGQYPKVIIVTDSTNAESDSILMHEKFMHGSVLEIMESPINLQRLRYLIDSSGIEYSFWRKKQNKLGHREDPLCVVQKRMRKVAPVETNILLTGETGVGKTYWAEWIHRQSPRGKKPFVVVNCGNFSPALVESQLFGHARGAFTGADKKQVGRFEFAAGGTIFLDEIDALPLEVQSKLLRVVENREFRPLGENKTVPLKARIISATNRNLDELVARQEFRADLVYRLNAYEIHIPALRNRTSQICTFCRFFADEFARKNDRKSIRFDDGVIELLELYSWPGNLRQLRNCMEHAAIDTEDGVVRIENLPPKILQAVKLQYQSPASAKLGGSLSNVECSPESLLDWSVFKEVRKLVNALEKHDYNRSKTAEELGVSRMTVYNMLKRHHLG